MKGEVNEIKEEETSHFAKYFPNIKGVKKSKTYLKESKHIKDILITEENLLNPGKINSINLHKFEKKFGKYPIFRSGLGIDGNDKNKVIVYTLINRKDMYDILLLRLVEHKKWINILDNKKEFKVLINEIKSNI